MEKRQPPLYFPRPSLVEALRPCLFRFHVERSGSEGYRGLPPRRSGQEMLAQSRGQQQGSCLPSRARQVQEAAPPLLHLPRFIPDEAGPLFVSHASCHRSRTSKETVSFHFQLCQMVLLCNQIWLRPKIEPKAPSDLMTFPCTLFSLTLWAW